MICNKDRKPSRTVRPGTSSTCLLPQSSTYPHPFLCPTPGSMDRGSGYRLTFRSRFQDRTVDSDSRTYGQSVRLPFNSQVSVPGSNGRRTTHWNSPVRRKRHEDMGGDVPYLNTLPYAFSGRPKLYDTYPFFPVSLQ